MVSNFFTKILQKVFPYYSLLTEAQIKKIISTLQPKTFAKKTEISSMHDEMPGVLVFNSGRFVMYTNHNGEKVKLFNLEGKFAFRTKNNIKINNDKYDVCFEFKDDTDAFLIPTVVYDSIVNALPEAKEFDEKVVQSYYDNFEFIVSSLYYTNNMARFAEWVLKQSNTYKTATLSKSFTEVGNDLDLTPEEIYMMFEQMELNGIVKSKTDAIKFEITNFTGLRELAETRASETPSSLKA